MTFILFLRDYFHLNSVLLLIAESYPYEIIPLIIANLGNVTLSTNQLMIVFIQ